MASILLVEDEESIKTVYSFALQREGFEVVAVPGAGQALIALEGRQFDVILLDMLLKEGMSGLDLLRSYDLKTKSPQTKVVVLSNIDSDSVMEKASALGVIGYLNKANTEPPQLAAYLKQLLASGVQVPSSNAGDE